MVLKLKRKWVLIFVLTFTIKESWFSFCFNRIKFTSAVFITCQLYNALKENYKVKIKDWYVFCKRYDVFNTVCTLMLTKIKQTALHAQFKRKSYLTIAFLTGYWSLWLQMWMNALNFLVPFISSVIIQLGVTCVTVMKDLHLLATSAKVSQILLWNLS